jgi:hypothetical protein
MASLAAVAARSTPTRPARYLIGWLPPDEAIAVLAMRDEEEFDGTEAAERAEAARRAAASRHPAVGTDGVVAEGPPELRACQARLGEANPRLASMFQRGLRLEILDLRRICAVQQAVFTDAEAPDIDPDDVEALAGWTLRDAGNPMLDVHYSARRRAWTVLVDDPNIRVVNRFRTDLEHGVGLGFELRQFGSSLQAVRFRDRFLLVDGYQRAYALLSKGVHLAPGLVGEADSIDVLRELALGLTMDVVLGPRPPLIPDFLDDQISAEVRTPVGPRVLVIEAVDIRTAG